jgi:hypothetical protein
MLTSAAALTWLTVTASAKAARMRILVVRPARCGVYNSGVPSRGHRAWARARRLLNLARGLVWLRLRGRFLIGDLPLACSCFSLT